MFRKLVLCFVGGVLIFASLSSRRLSGQTQPKQYIVRPRLVVMLVIDQFRYDYLVRYRPYFVQGGFDLLLRGADFVDCRYNYASTETCPGHSTLFTGAYSNLHGIISNEWYDATLHRPIYCVQDLGARMVGGSGGAGASPRNLLASTIGDELRMASDFKSRVVAVSLKDRAAVIPGGHTANAAYWMDSASGDFVSSTYYMQALPAWVQHFNAGKPEKAFCGQDWKALPDTPAAGSAPLNVFHPHGSSACPSPQFISWLEVTPYITQVELNFAAQAVENEHLGHGPATDLLTVSISANDYIGHAYGPYSPQVADAVVRTDRYLQEFFQRLDRAVGLSNVWITLSADHGVAPNAQFITEHRLGPAHALIPEVKSEVQRALTQVYGQGDWVEHLSSHYIYLNHQTINARHVAASDAEAVAARAAATVPGVRAAFTRTQFLTGQLPLTPLAVKASNSYFPARSGDIFLVLEPFAVPVSGEIHTTHGSPWNYDSQVPLIFWGAEFKPGIYRQAVQPIDLAATLAAALGLTQPSDAEGEPLYGALK